MRPNWPKLTSLGGKTLHLAVFFFITITCLYNFDPLNPILYSKTWVYIIFLLSAQNMNCGYSLEPSRRGGSNEYPQFMFLNRNMKKSHFFFFFFFFI